MKKQTSEPLTKLYCMSAVHNTTPHNKNNLRHAPQKSKSFFATYGRKCLAMLRLCDKSMYTCLLYHPWTYIRGWNAPRHVGGPRYIAKLLYGNIYRAEVSNSPGPVEEWHGTSPCVRWMALGQPCMLDQTLRPPLFVYAPPAKCQIQHMAPALANL